MNVERFLFKQNGQSRCEEEDETVDVESYGDETATSAMNLAAAQNNNNNNNVTKMDSVRPTLRPMPFSSNPPNHPNEEHFITSRSSIWQQQPPPQQQPLKHHRIPGMPSPPTMTVPNSMGHVNPMTMTCPPPPPPSTMFANESAGITPTSSDQVNDYDRPSTGSPSTRLAQDSRHTGRMVDLAAKSGGGRELKNGLDTAHINCDNANDEEVIVTNDDDECPPKKHTAKDLKRTDKSKYV